MKCLAVVDFSMRFLLFISGWDGCAADHRCMQRLGYMISQSLQASAILQMQAVGYVIACLFHIKVFTIIWLNGAV